MRYSTLSKGRKEGFTKFGTVFQLPIIRSPYQEIKNLYLTGRILDVGAGKEKYLKSFLNCSAEVYYSLDTDPDGDFSYRGANEIPSDMVFEWIIMNQLIEHLTIDDAVHLLQELYPHLLPGGSLIITTPNIFHPNRYWGDPTHVTPWGHNALYGLLVSFGYKVNKMMRYSKNRGPKDPLTWLLEKVIRHLYRIDWCDSIIIFASK